MDEIDKEFHEAITKHFGCRIVNNFTKMGIDIMEDFSKVVASRIYNSDVGNHPMSVLNRVLDNIE